MNYAFMMIGSIGVYTQSVCRLWMEYELKRHNYVVTRNKDRQIACYFYNKIKLYRILICLLPQPSFISVVDWKLGFRMKDERCVVGLLFFICMFVDMCSWYVCLVLQKRESVIIIYCSYCLFSDYDDMCIVRFFLQRFLFLFLIWMDWLGSFLILFVDPVL